MFSCYQRIEKTAQWTGVLTFFALPLSTSITLFTFLLTTLLTLITGHWKEKWTALSHNPVTLYFLSFFLIHLIGATYSSATLEDIRQQIFKFSWLLLTPLWAVLFTKKEWQHRAVNFFLAAMISTLILSFIKYAGLGLNTPLWHVLNAHWAFETTTVFKDYIVQSFLISLAAIIFLYRSIRQKNRLYGLLFLLATINIFLVNQSRTGYLIFSILLIYSLFFLFPMKKALIILIIGGGLLSTLLTLLPGPIHSRWHRACQDIEQWHHGNSDTSLGYRLIWQKHALILFKKRPVIGYGTGAIKAAYTTLPPKDSRQTGFVNNTSNEFLNISLQFGILGLVLFFTMLITQWRYSFLLSDESALLVQTLLIAIGIGSLANSWLTDFTEGHYYALMIVINFASLPQLLKQKSAA